MPTTPDSDGPAAFPVAAWVPDEISYADTTALSVPAFQRPSARMALPLLPLRAARHPAAVTTMTARGMSPREIGSALTWLDTAELYSVRRVVDVHGAESPVTALLRRGRDTPRPGRATPPLTGALIAQNEEEVIGGAIESLAPYVDEIVVLDGGSTDGTVEVARSCGARVEHRPFARDFAAQRNALLRHVRTPWVFMLDCDERLPEQLGHDVLTALRNSDVDAVAVPRLNLVDDDPVPTRWPDVHPRVHRTSLRYHGAVHERLAARSAVYLPLNGPCLLHHKSAARSYRQLRLYHSIDPGQTTPLDTERMQRWRSQGEETDS